jgi:hypothetical protein
MTDLFAAVRDEQQQGRSAADYLKGWSARLLQDTSRHRAALWSRLAATAQGLFEVVPEEYRENAQQLAHALRAEPAAGDETAAIWGILHDAPQAVPEEPALYEAQIEFAQVLAWPPQEEGAWLSLIALLQKTMEHRSAHAERVPAVEASLIRAYGRLRDLYAPDGALAEPQSYTECLLNLARLSPSAEEARAAYGLLVQGWDWIDVEKEMSALPGGERKPAVTIGLLCAWMSGRGVRGEDRAQRVLAYLDAQDGLPVATLDAHLLLSSLQPEELTGHPRLAAHLAQLLLQPGITRSSDESRDLQASAVLVAIGLKAAEQAAISAVENLARRLSDLHLPLAEVRRILRPVQTERAVAVGVSSIALPHIRSSASALAFYKPVVEAWPWARLMEEIATVGRDIAGETQQASIVMGLVCAWVAARPGDLERTAMGAEYLISVGWPLPERVAPADARFVVVHLGPAPLLDGTSTARRADDHRRWLSFLRHAPEGCVTYLDRCLVDETAPASWADDALEVYAEVSEPQPLRALLQSHREKRPPHVPPRLDSAMEIVDLMNGYLTQYNQAHSRSWEHVKEAFKCGQRRWLAPSPSLHYRDMLIAALRVLGAPAGIVAVELSKAQRYKEIHDLAKDPHLPAIEAKNLPRPPAFQEGRPALPEDRLYRQILQRCFADALPAARTGGA